MIYCCISFHFSFPSALSLPTYWHTKVLYFVVPLVKYSFFSSSSCISPSQPRPRPRSFLVRRHTTVLLSLGVSLVLVTCNLLLCAFPSNKFGHNTITIGLLSLLRCSASQEEWEEEAVREERRLNLSLMMIMIGVLFLSQLTLEETMDL